MKRTGSATSSALRFAGRNAIALAAILVAVGGTATASHLVVRASDIQKNAVRGQHIQKNAVKQKQVHRRNLSQPFGSGILGGQSEDFGFAAGAGGAHFTPPIGSGGAPDQFGVVAPRRLVLRDLFVSAEAPVVRRVRLRIRDLECTIEVGESSCHSGAQRVVIPRGVRFAAEISEHGPQVEMPPMDYRFAYRVVP